MSRPLELTVERDYVDERRLLPGRLFLASCARGHHRPLAKYRDAPDRKLPPRPDRDWWWRYPEPSRIIAASKVRVNTQLGANVKIG
jgi:hypothetical protein